MEQPATKRERTARRIARDDPRLTELTIGSNDRDHRPPGCDGGGDGGELWERMGADVARNTHLRELNIRDVPDACLVSFFRGMSGNRSIQKLVCSRLPTTALSGALADFFKTNARFECVELQWDGLVDGAGHQGGCLRPLAATLGEFASLKRFRFSLSPFGGEYPENFRLAPLLLALTCHSDLRELVLDRVRMDKSDFRALVELLQQPNTKIEVLHLGSDICDEDLFLLASSLKRNNSLKNVGIGSNNDATPCGWAALSSALSSATRLEKLDLSLCKIGDHALTSLASCTWLKELNLRCILHPGVSDEGWMAFARNALSSPSSLEKLVLGENYFEAEVIITLADSLARNGNTRLRELDLHHCSQVGSVEGWSALSRVLSSPSSALEILDISDNDIDDDAILAIATSLAGNSCLKELELSCSSDVTPDGWLDFSRAFLASVLRNPNSALEKLGLCYSTIDDAGVAAIASSLCRNPRLLRHLDLCGSENVTTSGWTAFARAMCPVLQSPDSALEKVRIDDNMDDTAAAIMASALVGNVKMKELDLRETHISSDGWLAFLPVVCNTSSIEDTWVSNHTLEKLSWRSPDLVDEMPEEVWLLLRLNRECSPSEAARLKIIKTHFHDNFAKEPFVGMELKVLPTAISWMCREEGIGIVDDRKQLGRVWEFLRSMPILFCANVANNKRKRDG